MSECFLDALHRIDGPRANEELVAAFVPLLEQLHSVHERGLVGPGVDKIYSVNQSLWFHAKDTTQGSAARHELLRVQTQSLSGVKVVSRGHRERDLDAGTSSLQLEYHTGGEVIRPVYVPGYSSWEQEVGHHDPLTDIFLAGMLLASLAIGADFTDPSELERFIGQRHRLTQQNKQLHPVIARAIVRMTELNRHERAQDLPGLIARLRCYRDVDERLDSDLNFDEIEGFITADRTSRRKIIQSVLQSRLFDLSRRNRLLHFKSTRQMLDLTMASVPQTINVDSVNPRDLFLWDGPAGQELAAGRSVRLDRFLRFEEAPWVKGVLDRIRSEDRRNRTEVGFSQLRLVVGFLHWHNLQEARDERIRSPLLLLPVELSVKRGVRTSYRLQASTTMAEVNPVLRHHLRQLYALDLPDSVDLEKGDLITFHRVLAAAIQRSEPGITLHRRTRPEIQVLRQTARRRTSLWNRRRRATGRGLRKSLGVDYSYSKRNFEPLGAALFRRWVAPEVFSLEDHLQHARVVSTEPEIEQTERSTFTQVEGAAGPYDWAMDLTHLTIGNFNYKKMSLVRDYDRMLEEQDGHAHPSFDTLFSLEPKELIAPPEGQSSLDLFTVVPADPSQAAAIHWARTGKSLIIQGPPGTGKSQTITNLIADYVARGKRVLFVCQKRAALDVVYHRLTQQGLDRLAVQIHDAQTDKKSFIADLKEGYEAWTAPVSWPAQAPLRDRILTELQEPLAAIQRVHDGFGGPAWGATEPVISVLNERLTLGVQPELDPEAWEQIPTHKAWAVDGPAVHRASMALAESGGSPLLTELSLRFVSREVLFEAQPTKALREGLDALESVLESVKPTEDLQCPEQFMHALEFIERLSVLRPKNVSLLDPYSGRSLLLEALIEDRASALNDLEEATVHTTHWKQKLTREDTQTALTQATHFSSMFFLFCWFLPSWWSLRALVNKRYRFADHDIRPSFTEVLGRLMDEYHAKVALDELDRDAGRRFGFETTLGEFLDALAVLRRGEGFTPLQQRLAKRWAAEPRLLDDIVEQQQSLQLLSRLSERVFEGGASWTLQTLGERVAAVRADLGIFPTVRAPLLKLAEAQGSVREAVCSVPLAPHQWDTAVCARSLEETWRANPELGRFNHELLYRHQLALSHGHHHLLARNAQVIRERVRRRFQTRVDISQRPPVELTDDEKIIKNAYNKGRKQLEREFEKVMRHRSIRDLSSGDSGTVVYDLKPIWLMSPLSISDTIPPNEQRFDVVIFDEASQIPLEEAVPAAYRAPQMIVVGDEMQLPPSNFFSTSRAEEDAERMRVAYDLDAESFLSHSARCLPSTMLLWHYRSRHEALIRFSNQAFYGGKLRTVPDRLRSMEREPIVVDDPFGADACVDAVLDRPVSFHRLGKSPYKNRTNEGEARYIAKLIRGLLCTENTVGVVAFSEAQQGAIESAIDRLVREDPVFRRAYEAAVGRVDAGQHVGLFIKNLENVQGDERDIILLSICYGPDEHGKMRMNFGPINKGGGEKRLNVVFSRAKKHMAVIASIEPSAITNLYNEGALCLHRYLKYAEAASVGDEATLDVLAGSFVRAEPEATAPVDQVRRALADALEDEGLVVVADVGSSDFRVDLAVGRDDEDGYGVAVLVDHPATYESGDLIEQHLLRTGILRAFGWTVVNVLSREWLQSPASCVERVLRALDDPASYALPPPDALVEPEPEAAETQERPQGLAGTTVVLTGALRSMSRAEATEAIRAAGGRVATAVTKRTGLVVVGQRPGAKAAQAAERGLPVLTEEDFLRLLSEGA